MNWNYLSRFSTFSFYFSPPHLPSFPNLVLFILPGLLYRSACDNVLEILMGPSVNTNKTRIPYYLNYEPNPTSVYNMIHWYVHVTVACVLLLVCVCVLVLCWFN